MNQTHSKAKILSLILLVIGQTCLQGCGADATSLSFKETLTVTMIGEFRDPIDRQTHPDAIANQTMVAVPVTGDSDPKNQKITLTGVTITDVEGEIIDLFKDAEPSKYTIVGRNQIIYEADLSSYKNSEIAGITVAFKQSAEATTPDDNEVTFLLPSATFTHIQDWKITPAINKRLKIHSQWKNTVKIDETTGTETVESPSIKTELINE